MSWFDPISGHWISIQQHQQQQRFVMAQREATLDYGTNGAPIPRNPPVQTQHPGTNAPSPHPSLRQATPSQVAHPPVITIAPTPIQMQALSQAPSVSNQNLAPIVISDELLIYLLQQQQQQQQQHEIIIPSELLVSALNSVSMPQASLFIASPVVLRPTYQDEQQPTEPLENLALRLIQRSLLEPFDAQTLAQMIQLQQRLAVEIEEMRVKILQNIVNDQLQLQGHAETKPAPVVDEPQSQTLPPEPSILTEKMASSTPPTKQTKTIIQQQDATSRVKKRASQKQHTKSHKEPKPVMLQKKKQVEFHWHEAAESHRDPCRISAIRRPVPTLDELWQKMGMDVPLTGSVMCSRLYMGEEGSGKKPRKVTPYNCFIAYMLSHRDAIHAQNPSASSIEVVHIISGEWASQPRDIKEAYKKLARELTKRRIKEDRLEPSIVRQATRLKLRDKIQSPSTNFGVASSGGLTGEPGARSQQEVSNA